MSVTSANAAVAETTGVVDPGATIPAASTIPSSTARAPAATPPASAGPIPQSTYGSSES